MIELLNTIARVWWNWTASMFWQVGLLILVIAALDLLIRKWAWPQLRYALWSLILVKLLLPPSLSLPSSVVPELRPHAAQVLQWLNADKPAAGEKSSPIVDSVLNVGPQFGASMLAGVGSTLSVRSVPEGAFEETPYGVTTNEVLAAGAERPSSVLRPLSSVSFIWQFYAMTLWLFGTLILGSWLSLRLHSVAGRQRSSAAAASLPQSFYNHLADCSKRLGLHRVPRVVVTKRLTSPAVFGVVSPVLLMPKGYLSKLSRRDTEHMLLHELAHIKRGDLVMHSLYLLLQIVYWYNPLLWLVRRHLHHLRELSCDGTVAELLRERTLAYRQTLLETARRMLTTSVEPGLGLLGLFEDSNYLLVRLHWLTKPTWRYCTMKRAIVATIALVMFACVLPMAQAQERASREPAPTSVRDDDPQVQDQQSQEIVRLQAQLEQLMAQQQKLQEQLKALAEQRNQMRGERRESPRREAGQPRPARKPPAPEVVVTPGEEQNLNVEQRDQLKRAQDQVRRAQEDAKRAEKEAAFAEREAARAEREAERTQGKHAAPAQNQQDWSKSVQAYGDRMKAYGAQMKQWEQSDAMKKWRADMEAWGQKMGRWSQEFENRQTGEAANNAEPPAMPPMPAMPAMPPMPPMPPVAGNMNLDLRMDVPVPHAVPHVVVPEVPVPPMPPMPPEHEDGREEAVSHSEQTLDVQDGRLLEVMNNVGSINVRNGEGPGAKVIATVKAKAGTKEQAQQIADQVKLVVTPSDQGVRVSMTKPENENRRNGPNYQVTLDVTVPRSTPIKVAQAVGSINLTGLRGSVAAFTQTGSIKATDVAGHVVLGTQVGSIDFTAPREFSAKVQAKANMGAIQSDLPLDVVKSPGMGMGSSASGTIGGGDGDLSLTTNVGSIRLRSQDGEPRRGEHRERVERTERSRPEPAPRPEPKPRPEPMEEF